MAVRDVAESHGEAAAFDLETVFGEVLDRFYGVAQDPLTDQILADMHGGGA